MAQPGLLEHTATAFSCTSLSWYNSCIRSCIRLATVVSDLRPCHSERSEESLFLPAAGYLYGLSSGNRSGYSTVSLSSAGVAKIASFNQSAMAISALEWYYVGVRGPVRLATVVSGLTGDVFLFLPAAGARTGSSVWYVNGHTQYWTVGVATGATPYKFLTSNSDFRPLWTSWGAQMAASVRLATVVSELAGDVFCSCLLWVVLTDWIINIRVAMVIYILQMEMHFYIMTVLLFRPSVVGLVGIVGIPFV